MSYSDIEHFSNMVTGCESISQGSYRTSEARYASAVLKLHAQDMGEVAGQEGFLDTIKRGAQNAVKWVKQLMTAIGNWFKTVYQTLTGKEVKEKLNLSKEDSEQLLVPSLERALEFLKDVNNFDVNDSIKDVEQYLSDAKKGGRLSSIHERTVNGLRALKDKLEKKVNALKESNEEDNREASKLGTDLKKIADANMAIYLGSKKAISGVEWSPGPALVKAVEIGGNRARGAIWALIDNNLLTIEELKKSIKYVEKHVDDLWVPYEVSTLSLEINKDRNTWNTKLYNEMAAYASMNFSKERIDNLVQMREYLRQKGEKGFEKVG